MSTTAAILELVVIGVQAMVWVLLLVCSVLGVGWIGPVFLEKEKFGQVKEIVGIVALCLAYPLGVAVDEFADEVMFGWRYRAMRDRVLGGKRLFLLLMNPSAAPGRWYFDYTRTKIRLVRSSCVNMWLIALAGAAAVERNGVGWKGWFGVYLAAVLGWFFWMAWAPIQRHQIEKTQQLINWIKMTGQDIDLAE